jgi:hypothetical protein
MRNFIGNTQCHLSASGRGWRFALRHSFVLEPMAIPVSQRNGAQA